MTEPNATPIPRIAMDFTRFRRPAYVLGAVMFVAVVAFACYSVFDLFNRHLNASLVESALAVLASVGVTVTVLAIVLTNDHKPTRAAGGITLIAWVLLTLALVGFNSTLRGEFLAVPQDLANVGQVAAALLAALSLIPAIVIPLSMNDSAAYASAAAAASRYVGFCAKLAAIGASTIASSYFGIARGMNPLLAVFCGVVLESCFLWAYLALVKATERGDVFDLLTWRIATVTFGLFIAAVSVETVSTLAQIRIPLLAALADAGAVLYVSAVGLAMVLTIAAHIVTSVTARAKQADGIRGTRTDLAEVRAALNGHQRSETMTLGAEIAMPEVGAPAPRPKSKRR